MHRRLRLHDEVADDHGDGNEDPVIGMPGDAAAQKAAHGHKAHVDPGEKQRKAHIHIGKTHRHAQQRPPLQPLRHQLEQHQKHRDGGQRLGRLREVLRQRVHIGAEHLHRVLGVGHHRIGIGAAVRLVQKSQQQHGDDGADGAQRHQAKAVAPRLLVAADGADAHAQRHNERHGHGPCGDAAGVEGHRPEVRRHEHGKAEHQYVEPDQQPPQLDTQQDTQQGDDQKHADAHSHRPDNDVVLNGGHLIGQHLQIRLRHSDDNADEEADAHDDPYLLGAGDLAAHRLSQRDHGHLRPKCEKPHAADEQHTAQQKRHHGVIGYRCDGKAQRQHDQHNGQHRGQRLVHGLFEDGEKALCLLPFFPQTCLFFLYRSSRQITNPFPKKMAYLSIFGQIRTGILCR